MSNTNLKIAKKSKNDEFYTRYEDIEKEMKFYTDYLKGKWVYSSCDDYRFSQFKTYFVNNFHTLSLKHFTCTNYDIGEGAYRYDYDGQNEVITPLNGDGDFRSEECIEYLKECDVVVTNPPFSLFRQYVKQLMDYNKKFIIIGNINAVTYKEIFPLIKDNKMWIGCSIHSGDRKFYVPDSYELNAATCGVDENGKRFINVKGVRWFTNIENKNPFKPLDLYKRYSFEDYPKYSNYDAIEVGKTAEIPMDYENVMGVPITFLDKYCPTQFEIIDINPHFFSMVEQGLPKPKKLTFHNAEKKDPYARILIRKIRK